MNITPGHFPTLYEPVDSPPCLWLTNVGEKDGTWWEVLVRIDSRRLVFSCWVWCSVEVIWNALTVDMKGKIDPVSLSCFLSVQSVHVSQKRFVFVIFRRNGFSCFAASETSFIFIPLFSTKKFSVSLQKSNGLLVDQSWIRFDLWAKCRSNLKWICKYLWVDCVLLQQTMQILTLCITLLKHNVEKQYL